MKIEKSQKGFSLLEIMIAIILASIMMTGAVIIYTEFVKMGDQDRMSLEAQRQGTYALGVMEKAIKISGTYVLGDYENEKYHKITLTTLFVDKVTGVTSAKDKEYYLDKTTSPVSIKEKDIQTSGEILLCPKIYADAFTVEDLMFTPAGVDAEGNFLSPVRIDLKLTVTRKVGETEQYEFFDFTVSAQLRNEN